MGKEHTLITGLFVANIALNSPNVPIFIKCDIFDVVSINSMLSDKNTTPALITLNYLNLIT